MSQPAPSLRRLNVRSSDLPPGAPSGARGVILSAALALFAERGFGATSIRGIAREAGVRSPTLYSHYPSKEHILAALIEIGFEAHQQHVRRAVLDSGRDPREQLAAFVRGHVSMHTAFPMLGVVAHAERHLLSPKLAARSLSIQQESAELLFDILQRGVDSKVFHVPDVWLAAAPIGGMGVRVAEWYTPEFHLSAEQVAEAYAEFALRIVGAVRDTPS
ncbi:MAG: TetR/AcrR family transcriptional regulator [Candidatus Binatia bacterium]